MKIFNLQQESGGISAPAPPGNALKVQEIMTRNPCVCAWGTSLKEVAVLMQQLNIGMIPVCSGGEVQGTVTDRDIAVRGVAEGLRPSTTSAGYIMSTGMIACYDDQSLTDAVALMEDHKVRRLLVKNREERLVGIVSLGDIATRGNEELAAHALKEISQPYPLNMLEDEDGEELIASVTSGQVSWARREAMDLRY